MLLDVTMYSELLRIEGQTEATGMAGMGNVPMLGTSDTGSF